MAQRQPQLFPQLVPLLQLPAARGPRGPRGRRDSSHEAPAELPTRARLSPSLAVFRAHCPAAHRYDRPSLAGHVLPLGLWTPAASWGCSEGAVRPSSQGARPCFCAGASSAGDVWTPSQQALVWFPRPHSSQKESRVSRSH